jgi:1-acyl-sn-glycerol-3-phosphate acyltransferase
MLYPIRVILLTLLLLAVTLYGLIVFPFFPRSKNKVYVVTKWFQQASVILGLNVELKKDRDAACIGQAVYIANHQNNFDPFTLIHAVPKRTVSVGKKSIIWIPVFGFLYWISGNFLLNRSNRKKAIETIDQIVSKMRETGLSIWMFPEGSRSRGRGFLPFKAGAFHAAIQAGVPIVPIVCSNTHEQVKWNRWQNGKVLVEMLSPISTKGLTEHDIPALMLKCSELMQKKHKELNLLLGRSL